MTDTRKLVKAGPASHTVSLPKQWVEKNNLKTGDSLYVTEKSATEMLISTQLKEAVLPHKEITITIDGKNLASVQREITAAYVNNYRSITLVGKEVEQELPALRTILQGFVALEITEQSPKTIVIKDLLDLSEISLDKTIRRMDMMVRTMLTECGKQDAEQTLRVKDEEVNKLYFLLMRLLKSALTQPTIMEQFTLSPSTVLQHWSLLTELESMADSTQTAHFILLAHKNKDARALLDEIKTNYETAFKAWLTHDKNLAEKVLQCRIPLVDECTKLAKHRDLVELMEHYKTMTSTIATIARLVVDEE